MSIAGFGSVDETDSLQGLKLVDVLGRKKGNYRRRVWNLEALPLFLGS